MLLLSPPNGLLSGALGSKRLLSHGGMLLGDTAFPDVLRLCVLPGRADFVFHALPCSETYLFTASFSSFLFCHLRLFYNNHVLERVYVFFFICMSSNPEGGLKRELGFFHRKAP